MAVPTALRTDPSVRSYRTGLLSQVLTAKRYRRKNLQMAWKKVKANQGAGGVDGESIETFGKRLGGRLAQLHEELRGRISPDEQRMLGIPTIYDRVCQQALVNRKRPSGYWARLWG